MSKESYAKRFCKAAASAGIIPAKPSARTCLATGMGGIARRGYRIKPLEKMGITSPTVGISNPQPTVSDVLNCIGLAQAHGIGTQQERTDAFGKIIDSGLVDTSPAVNALRMIGGGMLGHTIAGAFTNNNFLKGLGIGLGAVSAIK